MRVLPAAILVSLALSGCGASSPTAGEIEGVVHRWQLAVAERNVTEACSLLDERGRSMIKRELAGFVAAHATASSCPGLIGFIHDAIMTPAQRTELRTEKSREISVGDNTAKVRVTDGTIYWLTRINGGWRISEVPLAVG